MGAVTSLQCVLASHAECDHCTCDGYRFEVADTHWLRQLFEKSCDLYPAMSGNDIMIMGTIS